MDGIKVIATNKKAFHDYFVEETYEAGIALAGSEVKSLRAGRVNLKDSYARVQGSEVFLHKMHISPYTHGDVFTRQDPERPRKLLLHKMEIRRLIGKTQEKGLTLVPLKLYFKRGKAKVELGLVRGKHLHDKRATLAEKEAKRDIERAFRERQK
ncbi:MAG: SsrA-binding protein SmpB [Candidatus Aquicultorales bacterium]